MTHQCPHGNRSCSLANLCTPCSGTGAPVRDGEKVRRPMMMMDGMQRALHDRLHDAGRTPIPEDVRLQARIDHELWKAQQQTGTPTLDAHYGEILGAKGRLVSAQMREIADNRARVDAYADHYAAQFAAREAAARATPRDQAYADSVAAMNRGRG